MGFWKNLWKFLKFAGRHAPEIIAVIQAAKGKNEISTASK